MSEPNRVPARSLTSIWPTRFLSPETSTVIGPFAPTPAVGCSYDDFTDTTKDAYLVQVFGGVKDEICTPDWSTTLQNLGKTAFGYRTKEEEASWRARDPLERVGNEMRALGLIEFDRHGVGRDRPTSGR